MLRRSSSWRRRARAAIPLVALAIAACGGDSTPTQPSGTTQAYHVYPHTSTLGTGASRLFVVRDSVGNMFDTQPVTWTSSNSAVATVDAQGVVHSIASGAAVIVASFGGRTDTAAITTEPLRFAAINPGGVHVCGLTTRGEALCWGENSFGQLGDGTTDPRTQPAETFTDLAFTSLAAGENGYTCGLVAGGKAYCWGESFNGSLGTGRDSRETSPAPVQTTLTFQSLTAGYGHTCALTADGSAYCWGDNAYGQLGASTTQQCPGGSCATTPTAVSGGLKFSAISAGGFHTCALSTAGAAYCWGYNPYGQLGNGTWDNSAANPDPQLVLGGHTFAAISAGTNHTCALTTDGAAFCWGWNPHGELGAPSADTCDGYTCSQSPLAVGDGRVYTQIRAGLDFTCALAADSTAYCWGFNMSGQLGDGTTTDRGAPVLVSGGLKFASLDGQWLMCGLTGDNRAFCWGRNDFGQLGNGTTAPFPDPGSTVPVAVGSSGNDSATQQRTVGLATIGR